MDLLIGMQSYIQMNRNGLQKNHLLDLHQNYTEYTSHFPILYSVEVKKEFLLLFYLDVFKNRLLKLSKYWAIGRGCYRTKPYSVGVFQNIPRSFLRFFCIMSKY